MKKIESKMLNKRRMHIHNHKYIERIMFTHQLSHADKHSSDAHIYRKTFKKQNDSHKHSRMTFKKNLTGEVTLSLQSFCLILSEITIIQGFI